MTYDVTIDSASKKFATDFKAVLADAEALIAATASEGDDNVAAIRARAVESVKLAQKTMAEMQAAIALKSRQTAEAVDVYVHDSPWQSMGIAAGIGLAAGILLSRR